MKLKRCSRVFQHRYIVPHQKSCFFPGLIHPAGQDGDDEPAREATETTRKVMTAPKSISELTLFSRNSLGSYIVPHAIYSPVSATHFVLPKNIEDEEGNLLLNK